MLSRMKFWLYWLATLAACGRVSKEKPDAGVDAPPGVVVCPELVAECASESVLRTCVTVGEDPVETTCALGCSTDNGAHCRSIQPSFAVTADDMQPSAELAEITLSATSTINTDDGSITNLRTAGTGVVNGIEFDVRDGVGVFRFKKLTITGVAPSQTMTFTGTNGVAFVAIDSIEASNTIFNLQGSCQGTTSGPGGFPGGAGGGGNLNGQPAPGNRGGKGGTADAEDGDYAGGGGGGSHTGYGGTGGAGYLFSGGPGAMTDPNIVFRGGGGGGGGAGSEVGYGGDGGGGGGAIHLAANVAVKITGGGIQAGGCGGNQAPLAPGSGGGGGAGGIIVIEAQDIEIGNATLAANGGGGAGGVMRGTHGRFGTAAANGGSQSGLAGAGGAGNSSTTLNGTSAPASNGYGGGGGGAAGRIILRTSDGLLTTGNAVFSPQATMTGVVPIE